MTQTMKLACPACGSVRLKQEVWEKVFQPRGREVKVSLLQWRCQKCQHQFGDLKQLRENTKRMEARKALYDGLLTGQEIMALRKRYGLSQQSAAKIFGKGKIAFSRYENEVSYPDDSTTLMLQAAIEMPRFLKWLADRAKVELPMWRQRMRDDAAARRALRALEAEKGEAGYDRKRAPTRRKETAVVPVVPTARP